MRSIEIKKGRTIRFSGYLGSIFFGTKSLHLGLGGQKKNPPLGGKERKKKERKKERKKHIKFRGKSIMKKGIKNKQTTNKQTQNKQTKKNCP